MFALNNLFVALLVAIYVKVLTAADKHAGPAPPLLLSFISSPPPPALRWTRLGVLCGGIALGNQHTIVILLVPIALDVGEAEEKEATAETTGRFSSLSDSVSLLVSCCCGQVTRVDAAVTF